MSTRQIEREVAAAIARQRADATRQRRADLARAAAEIDYVDGRILELLSANPTMTHREIADRLGVRRQTVTERINAPRFQRVIQEANKTAVELYAETQPYAVRRLRGLLDHPDPHVVARVGGYFIWAHVHQGAQDVGDDFAAFVTEAYERAQKTLPAAVVVSPPIRTPASE